MRLCRFLLDDVALTGFMDDERVIPIHLACDLYAEATGEELAIAANDDILELLPPDGPYFEDAQTLVAWLSTQGDLGEAALPLDEVQLLVPIASPSKILLLAGNYAAHVAERGGTTAEREETFPYIFLKPPSTTLTNPGDPVVIPKVSPNHVDWECELGVVIGRACKGVGEAEALDYVGAYTVVNDVTDRKFTPNPARKTRERDKFFDWLHGKWHDTFCPMGPCLLTADSVSDPQAFKLKLTVNGETKQDGSTAQMVFPVAAIISFISQFVTLEVGDIISTGTPSGVGSATGTYLKPGDVVEASIEGIGTLVNPFVAEEDE